MQKITSKPRSGCLTQKASYEGGQSEACPPLTLRLGDRWWARCALPTLLIPFQASLRRPYLAEEFVHRAAQHAGLGVEFAGVRQHLGRRLAGCGGRRGNAADMGGDLVRS